MNFYCSCNNGCLGDNRIKLLPYFTCFSLQDDLKGVADIEGSLVIFCLATYGEGDPTDNATELYNWLKDETSPPDLTGLRYTVSKT